MRIIERKSPIIEAITKNNKNDEIDEVIDLVIETESCYLTEDAILYENAFTVHLNFKINKKKTDVNLYVRNKEGISNGGGVGGKTPHGPSVKIYKPKIDGEKPSIIVDPSTDELEIEATNKTEKEIKRKYSEILDFIRNNKNYIIDIYHNTEDDKVKEIVKKYD